MADSVQRRGRDTYVTSVHPDRTYAKVPNLMMKSGAANIYVYLPLPGVRKRTIESATLSVPIKDGWVAQTLTATPVDEDWAPRKTTWNAQPALRGSQAVSQAQAALADGDRAEIDVTAHVQKVADGAKHYGWRVTTGDANGNRVYGFGSASGFGSWHLVVNFIEAPEAPTDLAPNGHVVSQVPVLTYDFTDLGGESTELAAHEVQVNTSASATGAWDSGELDTVLPQFDLAANGWPTSPVSGTTYYWRVRVKDGAGYWSEWSDWASFPYAPKPVLTIDNPASGLAWDPSPTIAAHIDTGVIKAWRIRVARGNDKSRVIYDSGKKPGTGSASLAHTIPFRDDEDRRILKDDHTYWLNIRIWDRNDREATPGDPTYTGAWTQFVLDDDATPAPVEYCSAIQVGDTPRVRVQWQRTTGFATGWVVRRDGEVIARLDTDEVTGTDDAYTWVDDTAAPFVEHYYTVKAIDGGKQTVECPRAYVTTSVAGVWLLSDADGDVVLDGIEVTDLKTSDKRANYQPINRAHGVDIVYALGGVAGTYAGTISVKGGRDWWAARGVLLAMRDRYEAAVRLVYGTTSVPVHLKNVSVLPAPSFQGSNGRHDVSFDLEQTGEYEVSV